MTKTPEDDRSTFSSEETPLIPNSGNDNDSKGADSNPTSHEPPEGFVSRFRLVRDAPIEVKGCAIDVYARAPIYMAAFFVGPALLKLASQQAIEMNGCSAEDNGYEECVEESRIYGFKPSSLLTNMKSLASLVSMVSLPLFGAVVDFTPARRQVGILTAVAVVLIKIFELVLGSSTWFFVVCLQVLSDLLYQYHSATMESYAAEISYQPKAQSKYQSSFAAIIFASMFMYVLEVTVLSIMLHLDSVQTARISILISLISSAPLFLLAWKYFFRDRKPASEVPNDQTIVTAGFHKLHTTLNEISNDYSPVKHFLAYSCAWSEAAVTALPLIATTYMTEFLGFNSQEIGMALLVTMFGGMPGAFVGDKAFAYYKENPVRSAQLCLSVFTINTLFAGIFLRPSTRYWMYAFAFVWGLCEGWMRPQHMTIFVTIAPMEKGAVELMGLFIFFRNVMVFIPPMLFTILNELGIPMWVGLSSLTMFSIVGLIGLTTMENYEDARKRV